jgi:hypothetical protein
MTTATARSARRKVEAQPARHSPTAPETTPKNDETATMKILEIFDRSGSDHSLKPLDQSELTALEAILSAAPSATKTS